MDKSELHDMVLSVLGGIAPETDFAALQPDRPLREQIDLDSMDWLNVMLALHERLRVDIPEADYGKLATLDAIVDYLGQKLGKGETPATTTAP